MTLSFTLRRIAELALSILKEDLRIQDEHPSGLAPAPTSNFVLDAIGRECSRRAFWYIKLMHLTAFAYYQIHTPPIALDSKTVRLPVDEASFEFGAHNSQSGPLVSSHSWCPMPRPLS